MGGVAFALMDKKKEGVVACEGIRHRGARVDGENARAADSICAKAGGRGVGGLTCFVLRGQKIDCHSLAGLAQPPSDHAGGGERTSQKIGRLCHLTNCLI